MTDARKLTMSELRSIVVDGAELSKGAQISDAGALTHLSRYQNKLFGDAKGSGTSPYKVQVVIEDDKVRGRCSCMAARSRPFCKHAAAVLVAWSQAPESFAVADVAPAGMAMPGDAKKKTIKKGKVDTKALMGSGVEQVVTLVGELAASGIAAVGGDRAAQIRALGEVLRENRLRRLSARVLELAGLLEGEKVQDASFDPSEYTDLVADMLLVAKKIEKHLGGETLDPRHVEELIGKTWTKKDRTPADGMELVEYAFSSRTTADEFYIRESRFVDIATGEHYSEKQILPGFLVRRTPPKPSYVGKVIAGKGSVYPTFPPRRLDLEGVGDGSDAPEISNVALERLATSAVQSVGAALAQYQERRKDVFAPDVLPIALKIERVLAKGRRLQAVDDGGAALFLPDDPVLESRFAGAVRGGEIAVILGDIILVGALPTLVPLAVVVRTSTGHELRSLVGLDLAVLQHSKKVDASKVKSVGAANKGGSSWVEVARANDVSTAALVLGEVREELASAFMLGLPTVNARFAEALAARLGELGLKKPSDLLVDIGARPTAEAKLDDFVKLYQVLGIALTRLAGATTIDLEQVERAPTFDGIWVQRVEGTLDPHDIGQRVVDGSLTRYEASVHYARYYDQMPAAQLAEQVYPAWADGSAAPYVIRALTGKGAACLSAVKRVLQPSDASKYSHHSRHKSKLAMLTALAVLEAAGGDEARELAGDIVKNGTTYGDEIVRQRAIAVYQRLKGDRRIVLQREKFEKARFLLLNGATKDLRKDAVDELVSLGYPEGVPFLRASFQGDVSRDVREQSAYALARLGDTESYDEFAHMLRSRHVDHEIGKVGAYALGHLGDVRGAYELLRAYEDGWLPQITLASIAQVGPAALEPLLRMIETNPAFGDRKGTQAAFAAVPESELVSLMSARFSRLVGAPDYAERAAVLMRIARVHNSAFAKCAAFALQTFPNLPSEHASKEEKALYRLCAKKAAGEAVTA